jgi:hypothetical protein
MITKEWIRRSSVAFSEKPMLTELLDNWQVIQAFEDEGEGPALIDLSHIPRWNFNEDQSKDSNCFDLSPPSELGRCALNGNRLCFRTNREQGAYWNPGLPRLTPPEDRVFTDITDATAVMALLAADAYGIMEKLSKLNLAEAGRRGPWVLQGPVAHVPCQVVVLEPKKGDVGILISCDRGYGVDMAACMLSAGRPEGVRPAGFLRFSRWFGDFVNDMEN